MEDNGRELDPDQINTPPVKDGNLNSKKLTIMLFGSVGKMHSFKISRKFILFTSIFFLIYIITSLLIFYLYFDLYAAHKAQSNTLLKLEAELSDKTKALKQNDLYIKVLEDYRKGLDEKIDTKTAGKKTPEQSSPKVNVASKKKSQNIARKRPEKKAADTDTTREAPEPGKPKENVPSESKSEETAQKGLEEKTDGTDSPQKKVPESDSPVESVTSETKSQVTAPEEAVTDPMEIRGIDFQRTGSELTLNFILANKLAEQKTAEGYIHIIVMNKNKECPSEWNNSYNKLSNGFPINFNRGQQFLIQSFRPYQRKYKTNPDSELPSFIRILVYDQSGQKILEKEFPVTGESSNDPS